MKSCIAHMRVIYAYMSYVHAQFYFPIVSNKYVKKTHDQTIAVGEGKQEKKAHKGKKLFG